MTRTLPLAALFLIGCVTSDHMAVGKTTYPPRPDDWVVEVYVGVDAPVRVQKSIGFAKSVDEIPENAQLIGRVDAQGAELASWGAVIDEAKTKARALGGDGLVVGSWGSTMTHVDAYGGAHYGKGLSFSVIRYNP
jgi:hypothetical protein